MSQKTENILFDRSEIDAATSNVSDSIISEFSASELNEVAFIGIQRRGVQFSERLAAVIKERTGANVKLGSIDISMYRDDIGLRKALPAIRETVIPFDINDRNIILTDDVLFTGRTIRAALDAITDYGRPRQIRLAVLVDRGLREFPIRADYTGLMCDVESSKKVKVFLHEIDGEDTVYEI